MFRILLLRIYHDKIYFNYLPISLSYFRFPNVICEVHDFIKHFKTNIFFFFITIQVLYNDRFEIIGTSNIKGTLSIYYDNNRLFFI